MVQNPVQGAIPTNLPNTAVGLRPPYSPSLPAPSPQLPPAFFSTSISDMPPMEPYSPLGQRDQGSTQAQDALGGFPSDGEGKGVAAGGLDSLSEYTLPGKQQAKSLKMFFGSSVKNLKSVAINVLTCWLNWMAERCV